MNAIPKFEPLEDRIVLDGEATVSIDGPDSIFIGDEDVAFTLTFDNTDPTETGYVPFIDLVLPTNGADGYDGIGPLNPDDISFLGADVPFTEIVFDGSGNAEHPLAVDTNGDPIIISGTPGDTLVVIELPYGSFSPGNPAVDIDVSLDFSDLADLSSPFNLTATGGFAFGCDPLDNPADDPSTFGATDNFVVTQQLFEVAKTNNIPEAEAATGPSYVYTHTITVDVAEGQTISNFQLVDNLPPEMFYLGNLNINNGGVEAAPSLVNGPAGAGNNELIIDFASISGSSQVVVTFDFYLMEMPAGSTDPTIDVNTGDQAPVINTVTGTGTWTPLDPNDDPVVVSDSDDDIYQATSLAVQKSGVLSTDDGVTGPTPGDIYDFTLNVQVSDYFTYGDLLITDTLGNGFSFVDGSAALVAIVDDTGDTYTLPVDLTPFETQTAGSGATAGETTNVWDISAALLAAGDADGLLTGDDVDGVFDGSNTTIQIFYQAEILDQYADNGAVTDVELSQGDFLSNDTRVSGTVRDNIAPANVVGTEENESATEVQLPFGAIREKTVYAINGVVPSGDVVISAGDEVTWRIVYDAPLGSFEMLRIADNLPQNVFDATEVTTFITNPVDAAVAPPAGSAQYGGGDQFSALGGGDPTITIDAPNNGVNFGFNNLSVDPRAPVAIELLFTVTVEDAIFADGLLLTNQATAFEANTFSGEVDTTAIAQFVYAEPILGITKGIVATDSVDPATAFTDTTAPTPFTDPGLGNPRFAGTISSDDLAADPIDADLDNIDAGDLVTFAIVVENTGSGPNGAFNVTIEDTLPPGFEIPGGAPGLNLSVTDGTGTRAIGFTGDLFTTGIVLDDRGLEGSLSAYDPLAGDNLVIITYDLLASDSVTSNDVITNTATLSNYNAFEGSPTNVPIDRTPVDLTDDAVATVADVEITKTLQGREFGEGSANEVLIGEEFTFTVRMDIQEGTYTNAVISDSVSTGAGFGDYEILSAEMTDWNAALLASTGVTLGSAGDVAADGNSVSFDLGTLTNQGTNTIANDFFEFEVTARSLGGDSISGGDDLGNDANFSADGVDVTESQSVDLTEPTLTIDKTADPAIVRPSGAAGAGETINYALNIANIAGASDAPAYDLVITDVLDPNVTLDVGSVTVLLDGDDVSLAAVTIGNSGGDTTIQINIDVLDEGLPLVVTYTATVIPDVEAAVIIDNTANLTFDTLETDDADDERDYSLDADADVPVVAPAIDKAIIATSNPDTVGGDLAIGETVTYQIVIDIPEGASTNAVLQDVLPTTPGTLTYVDSEVVRIGFASGAGDITGSDLAVLAEGDNTGGATTTFDFGDLLNANNLTINAGDQIVVNVTAILTDLPANQSGDTLVNTATFSTDSVSVSDTATVDVVEPVLNIDKSGLPIGVDAGDTVTYTVQSQNTGNGPAYDIIIDDDLADTGLIADTSVAATIVILDGGGADVTPVGLDAPSVIYPTAGGGLQASIPVLLPGQTIEIVYQSIVTDLVEFDGSVDNTAEVTRFDSDPAGDGTDADDGRVYDSGLPGYTVPSDDESIDTPAPTFAKTIVATDNADTVGGDVAISEIITYELEITIPEGTSTLVLTDDLPAGLVPVSAEVTTYDVAAISSNLTLGDTDASGFISVGPDGGYVFDFGTLTNTGDNIAANNTIIVTVQAQVDDIAAVADGANLENTATLALVDPFTGDPLIDPDTGLPQTYSDTAEVDVVEPVLDIDKTVVPLTADAGDTVTYTVVSTNTGSAPAYDIIIDDTLFDPAIAASAPAVASIVITDAGGGVVTPAEAPSITYPTAGGGLQASIPALQPGETITITFEAVVTDLAEFSGDVDNTAEVTRFDTDPEGDGTDADDGRVYDSTRPGYTVPSADAEVLTPEPTFAKTIVATDNADTVGGDVAISEIITYELEITIPEGTSTLVLTDDLPAGLVPVSAEVTTYDVAAISSNLTLGDTDASGFISVGPDGGYVFDFGTLTNTGDNIAANNTIIVTVQAQVDDIAAVADGANLENTATLALVDPVTGDPLIDPDTGLPQTYSDTADVDVVEPVLDIDKTVVPLTADAGDTVTYTVVSTNTGSAPAYDIIIDDTLFDPAIAASAPAVASIVITDAGGGVVTPVEAPSITYPTAGGGLQASIPVLLPGETITITFEAVVTDLAEFSGDVDNTAEVTRFDTDPEGDGTGADDGRVYDSTRPGYTVPSADAEVLTPDVALAKDYTSSTDVLTDDGAQNVGIGEVITYTLTISVPEGTGGLVLNDVLPAGLEALSASVVSLGSGGNTTTENLGAGDTDASGFITIAPGGGSVIYDFGTAMVTGTDDAAATGADLVVEVVSRVRNLGTNVDTLDLTNTATLQVTDPVTGLPVQTDPVATETVTVVEPNLTIEKIGPIATNPGDILPYQIVIENTGTGPAYDILIQDPMITAELALLGTPTFTVTPSGTVLTPTVLPLGDGFSTIIPALDVGETLTVDFQVQISAAAEDAESFVNTATIDYDTVPDGDPASATGRTYDNEDDHSVGTVPFLVKTATDSELSETGADQYDADNIDLVVGEEVTYTFDLYLPEIPMDSVVMVDTLPTGLQFVSANFFSAGLGLTEGGTLTALSASSVIITNTDQVTEFDFGAVDNPNDGVIGDDDVITVQIVALVLNDPAVTSDGDTLTNNATLDVSAGGTDLNQATATEVVDVVDPELTIDKTGPLAAEPGDTVTYNVTIENTGTGPAYDTVVTDLMDDPNIDFNAGTVTFTPALTPSNPAVVASGDGFTFTVPLLLPGEEVIFTYTADIALTAPATIGYDNTVTADYSSSPDGDGRDKTGSDDHSIGGSPTLEKAILSTNIDATGNDQFGAGTPDVVIGEEITYALTITLPEIPMGSVVIQDTLPDGLEFVTASLDVANTGVPGATPTIVNSGQITTFDFGALTNPVDGSIGADDEIVVLITARVTTDILNVDGLPLTNNATLNVTPEGETPFTEVTDASTVEIVEPEIVVDKVGPIAVDQGDTVPYTVTITNTGTGPAADLLFSDPMDPGGFLSFDAGSVTAELTPAVGVPVNITAGLTVVPDGNGFTVLFDELLAGAEITLTYTATLDADAPQAQSFVNTATVNYDTVPDGDPATPTGRPDTDSDDHSIATNPSLTKDATASSFADTGSDQGDGDLLDLNIGEEVTYTLQLTLPEIEMDSVVLQDTLPAGLTFVSAQVLDLAGVTPAGVVNIVNAGQITTFDFGAVSNPSDGSLGADDVITVEIVAIVANDPANIAITPLTNTAALNITPQGEPPLEERSAEETVEVVEPELELEKVGPLAVNPGDTIPYEITVTNTGSGAAYDVVIADAVANANLDFTAGTVVVTLDGITQSVTIDESGTGFSVEVPVIQAGQTLRVTYDAVLSPDATPANSFANDATVVFDNIPGDPADPTLDRPGTDTDDHIVATIPTLDKNVIATSNPDTGDDVHEDGIQDLAIGEEVTYELVLTLPEIDMGSVILTDALPVGLTFVSFEVTEVGAGLVAGDPMLTQNGQLLSFDFGRVVNPFDGSIGADDQITVQVTTLVANVPSNADGMQLTNTGSLTVTPQGGTPLDTQTDTATIDVVEPELVLDKSVSDITPTIGDTITYTLVLTNEGTSPAYNVIIDDPLPFQLLLTGNVVLSDPSLGTVTAGNTDGETLLVIDIPRLMPGETITVDYDVFIGFQSDVLSGLVNVADVSGSSSPGEGGGVISGRPSNADADAIIVADPVPTDEGERKRIPNLGIDDAQFLPVLSIDPIYSGTAEPGSNVTVSLYRDNGALSYSRHIMADAGGHWIAIFPRVEHEQVTEDFWDFYAGSNVFDAPVRMIDDADLTGLAFADDTRSLVVGADIAEESYDLQLRTDRSSMLPQDHPMHNARTFYANAIHQMPFLRADTLNVGEVFENIAADTVSRLYEASTNPLGDGLNRFNYEFLSEATASPGSAR